MRPLRLLMVPVLVLVGLLLAPLPARADGLPTVRFTTAPTGFSPNGDGVEDVLETAVETSEAGHVRVVVETPTVRRLLLDRTVDAAATLPVTWDGQTDDGALVPGQTYTLVATLTWDGGGRSAELRTEVLSQPRAQLTSPAAGALLIAQFRVSWQGRQPDGVRYSMTGCAGDWQQFTSEGGNLVPSVFTLAGCTPGPQQLTATSVRYAFGSSHVVQVDTIPVEVAGDGPALVLLPDSADKTQTLVRYDDGGVDAVRWPLRCLDADRSSFVLRINDAAGSLVRTVLGFQTAGADCDGQEIRGPSWDGLDDQGEPVPEGRYAIEAQMRDAEGRLASDRAAVIVSEQTAPLRLTTPAPDDGLGSALDLGWTVASGVSVQRITTRLTGCEATLPYGWTLREPAGRSVSQRVDLSRCQPGRQRLSWSVDYTDEDGLRRSFERSLLVTVHDVTAPVITQSGGAGGLLVTSFRPSKVGVSWWFSCADATTVTVSGAVHDATGRRVATIPGYVPMPCPDWSGSTRHYLSWDGLGDDGERVADGSYAIVLTATDEAGNVSRDSMPVEVDARPPVDTSVQPGDEVAQQDVLTWTPRDEVTLIAWRSRILVRGADFETEVVGLTQDSRGRLIASGIGTSCAGHTGTLDVDLVWIDRLGAEHGWNDSIAIRCVGARRPPAELGVVTQGTPRTGQTLAAVVSGLGSGEQQPRYEWQRDGRTIAGATTSRYLLSAADVGHSVRVRIRVGGSPARTATSPAVRVAAAALVPATPSLRGVTRVGQTLSVVSAAWRPGGVVLSYQWLRDGRPIARATGSRYALTAPDRATRISVRVVGRKAGYVTATRTSAASARIR